jgi:type I restriction enzyme S subunit
MSAAYVAFKPDRDYPIDASKLPTTWAITTVGDGLLEIRHGFSSGDHNAPGVGVPQLRPTNIDRHGRVILDSLTYVNPRGDFRAVRGDVLFNNTNSPELIGKTAPLELDGEWSFSNHITCLRLPPQLLPCFLAYQFLHLFEEGYFRLRCTRHINQASINGRTLAETVPLVLAPLADQQRIVRELDYYFDRLAAAERAVNEALGKLARYRRVVVLSAAEGRLVLQEADLAREEARSYEAGDILLERLLKEPQGGYHEVKSSRRELPGQKPIGNQRKQHPFPEEAEPGALPTLPKGWTWARVDQVGEVLLGRRRSPVHHQGPNMRPYLRVANVQEDRIDTSDVLEMNFTPSEYEKYALRRGDILLNEGQSPELVGRPAMYRDEVPGACFQNTLIRFRAHSGVSPTFALLVFRSYLHSGRFKKSANWTTNIAHIGAGRFAALEFPLPPLAEQERIVNEAERRLTTADSLSEVLLANLVRISRARRAALERAFSGTLAPLSNDGETAVSLLHDVKTARSAIRASTSKRPKDGPMVKSNLAGRRKKPLVQVLSEQARPLTPEELLSFSNP